ncbi:MAG: hypothetical protein DLM73_07965 [Chthoniobacterales bacterium]|nr:MAG: hypothetical protein DLM73_07965 [Chthoniobacterales bacterium]
MKRDFLVWGAHAFRGLAIVSTRSRTSSARRHDCDRFTKFISVEHRNQHAASVRSPIQFAVI